MRTVDKVIHFFSQMSLLNLVVWWLANQFFPKLHTLEVKDHLKKHGLFVYPGIVDYKSLLYKWSFPKGYLFNGLWTPREFVDIFLGGGVEVALKSIFSPEGSTSTNPSVITVFLFLKPTNLPSKRFFFVVVFCWVSRTMGR